MKDLNGNTININFSNLKVLGSGSYGTVYKLNKDECFKKIDVDINYKNRILINNKYYFLPVFLYYLKNHKYKNLCEIKELFFNENNQLIGYIMEYLSKDSNNILLKPTEYLLDNFNDLYKTIITLSNENYMLYDLKHYNCIMTENYIKLIDFDLYSRIDDDKFDLDYIKRFNIKNLIILFYNLIDNSLLYLDPNENYSLALANLFDYNNKDQDLVINNINKTLIKYKKPIDYYRESY